MKRCRPGDRVFRQWWGGVEFLGELPGLVEVVGIGGDGEHGAAPDAGAPAALVEGGEGHEFYFSLELGHVVAPRAGEPVRHEGADDGALDAEFVFAAVEFLGFRGHWHGTGTPEDDVTDGVDVLRRIDVGDAVGVEERAIILEEEDFDLIALGGPEVEEVVFPLALGVLLLHEGAHEADVIVPGFDLIYVDAGGFDDVGTVAEHDGVDIVGDAEDVAAGGPGGKGGFVELVVEVFILETLGEVVEGNFAQGEGEEAPDLAAFDFHDVADGGAGVEAGHEPLLLGGDGDLEKLDAEIGVVGVPVVFEEVGVQGDVGVGEGPEFDVMVSVAPGAEEDADAGDEGDDEDDHRAGGDGVGECAAGAAGEDALDYLHAGEAGEIGEVTDFA